MELLDLPDELLSKIFRYLPTPDVASASLVCRRLHEIERNGVQLWKWFCWRDFKASEEQVWNGWSYKDFYTKALYKYGFLFGCWKRTIQHYGGLILVRMEKDAFVAYECLPPLDDFIVTNLVWVGLVDVPADADYSRDTFNTLRLRRLFAIEPIENEAKPVCYQLDQIGLESVVHDRASNQDNGNWPLIRGTSNGFIFTCPQLDEHDTDFGYFLHLHHGIVVKRPELAEVVMDEFEQEGYDLHEKFVAFGKALCDCQFEPLNLQLDIPSSVKNSCVKPGLYFSLYSVHGWEMFDFRYSEDGGKLEGIKVKGDPNIPAGQVSVRVLLTKPVHLTAADQTSIRDINMAIRRARDKWTDQSSQPETDGLNPFLIPFDCHTCNEAASLPKFYRWAFLSECQVAERGYSDPKFEECLFFGFDDDNFAVLWLEYRMFFHYFRATNIENLRVEESRFL